MRSEVSRNKSNHFSLVKFPIVIYILIGRDGFSIVYVLHADWLNLYVSISFILHYTYTILTLYLHYIYTILTQYLHFSVLDGGGGGGGGVLHYTFCTLHFHTLYTLHLTLYTLHATPVVDKNVCSLQAQLLLPANTFHLESVQGWKRKFVCGPESLPSIRA